MPKPRSFPHQRVCVFGAARSGIGAMSLLRHHKIDVVIADERPALDFRSVIRRLNRQFVTFQFGEISESVLNGCDALVVSPGIPLSHWLIEVAQERGMAVLSEVELASYFAGSPICAITGTNGKTTTTTLVGQMIEDAGFNSVVSGNIGRAFSDGVLSSQDSSRNTRLITEISSFQLESIDTFHPHVAAILNISRDHMDRYRTMKEYVEAKFRITRNQTAEDFLVLNQDDPMVMKCAERTKASVWTFSFKGAVKQGAYVSDGTVYLVEDGKTYPFCALADIPIPGKHNVENTLASLVMGRRMGVSTQQLLATLRKFKGVEHRIEFVAKTKEGVAFYNDSKATNVDSLEKALLSFDKPIVLVAGGRDKQSSYERLNQLVKDRVKSLVLIGEAAPLILKHWGPLVETKTAANMKEAVNLATRNAGAGDVVLLSPACASFDMYKNYEERGNDFKKVVREIVRPAPRA